MLAGWGQAWTKLIAQNFWTLAFVLGLIKTWLDFFHNGTVRYETLGTWAQPFVSTPINLTTKPHPPTCESPEIPFLGLCERTSFPPATSSRHGPW